jgi:hypothetical protein
MTLFTYISQNIDRIKVEVKFGIISCTLIKHWLVYSRYEYYRRLKNCKTDAIIYVCNDYQVEERSVYYIIKKMESEI